MKTLSERFSSKTQAWNILEISIKQAIGDELEAQGFDRLRVEDFEPVVTNVCRDLTTEAFKPV